MFQQDTRFLGRAKEVRLLGLAGLRPQEWRKLMVVLRSATRGDNFPGGRFICSEDPVQEGISRKRCRRFSRA